MENGMINKMSKAREILEERLAKDEITADEFRAKIALLNEENDSTPSVKEKDKASASSGTLGKFPWYGYVGFGLIILIIFTAVDAAKKNVGLNEAGYIISIASFVCIVFAFLNMNKSK